jgi:hypothetical protein
MTSTAKFEVGDRVQARPATDAWMRGDKFGTVTKIGRLLVHVRMDVSKRVVRFGPENLLTN